MNIRQIARECGVSACTVSNIINNKGRVGAKTREKVEKHLQQAGYDPLQNVPAARVNTTGAVGLVLPLGAGTADGFYYRAIMAATAQAKAAGSDCRIILEAELEARTQATFRKGRAQLGCDSLLLFCPSYNWPHYIPALRAWSLPTAIIRRRTDEPGIICIDDDDYNGFRLVMEHLAERGHRSIAMLRTFTRESHLPGRTNAYRDVLEQYGHTPDPLLEIGMDEPDLDLGARLAGLMETHGITALACAGDNLAAMAGRILLSRGVRIPGDIAVTGYDDDPIAKNFYPGITTVSIPVEEMVEAAYGALFNPNPVPGGARQLYTFKNKLIVRESTGQNDK